MASASEASELFFAWWPSSSFPNPGWPDIEQNFKCAHRILTTNGFLIVADPENVTGDGKSWVLECKPTVKLPKDADPADLARQCLESEGVKVDAVVQLDESDRTLHVALSPPPQPITSLEVREEPWTKMRTKLLQKIHGVDVAKLSTISSVAITKEWMDAHEGANPPMEYVIRETMKRTGQALGVTPTPPPQPEEQNPKRGENEALGSTGQQKVDVPVMSEKLPTTAEAVSKQLLTEVNSLFKKFRMRRFENVEDLAEADEWRRLNHWFRGAGESYAKASFREERGRLEWSRKNIESDRQAIHQQHAQHFCLLQSRRSDLGQ